MIDVAHFNKRFPVTTKLIVAVSGGADSVALLDILCCLGYSCVIAHCNFHLRGDESDRDERFVTSLALRYKLSFRKIDFQTKEYAALKSVSIEMAARELRYDWFRQLCVRENADYIAVAHHADDVVETFLMNLSRGTGLRGLTGIKELAGRVWRPLLDYSKQDIMEYITNKELPHVEDSTNGDSLYTRNKFRNEIIPMFQTVYPTFKNNVKNTIGYLQQTESFLQEIIEEKRLAIFKEGKQDMWELSLPLLLKEPSAEFLLYEFLSPYGFSVTTIQQLKDSIMKGQPGKSFFSKGNKYVIVQERETLLLKRMIQAEDKRYKIHCLDDFSRLPLPISAVVKRVGEFEIVKDAFHCYLDMTALMFPLVLRRWQNGDWFIPFGMKGKKKISDYFVDQKISNEAKKNAWILTTEDDSVAWIVGFRSDNRFRVSTQTSEVLCLSCVEE
jgi:tRNA(Ile)-lysidine synthase